MKIKKLRGHKRILKEILKWKNDSLELDLKNLESYGRNYEKVWVSPYSNLSMSGSQVSSPKGKTRKMILESLLTIFNSWEAKVKELNKPYYLAIWFFDNNIEKSQVVCAIDQYLDFYNATFYRPERQLKIPIQNFGKFSKEIESFNWIYALDEGHFTKEDVEMTADEYYNKGEFREMQKWYKRKLKENLRTFVDKNTNEVTYFNKQGNIWIGKRE